MGYYSEVAIKCGKKAYGMLKETCTRLIMPDKIFKDGDEYILHWDWIRWDENEDIIKKIKNTFNKLDELQDEQDDDDATGYGYKFIRIGESNNDVETRENDEDIELCIICKIDIPDNLAEINPEGKTSEV